MRIFKLEIKKDLFIKVAIVIVIVLLIFTSLFLLSPERRTVRAEEQRRSTDMQTIGSAVNLTLREKEITIDHVLICSADSPKTFNDTCARKVGMSSAPVDPIGLFYRIDATEDGRLLMWSPDENSRWGNTKNDARIY